MLEEARGQFRPSPGEPISFGWFRSFFTLIGEAVADKYHVRRARGTALFNSRGNAGRDARGTGEGCGQAMDGAGGDAGGNPKEVCGREPQPETGLPGAAGHHGQLLRGRRRAGLGAPLRPGAEAEASACARLCARIALAF